MKPTYNRHQLKSIEFDRGGGAQVVTMLVFYSKELNFKRSHCDQTVVFFSIFGHVVQHWKAAQKQFCQRRLKNWQKLNKPWTIWQRFIKCCQSGEISPNLVTLNEVYNLYCAKIAWEERKQTKQAYNRFLIKSIEFLKIFRHLKYRMSLTGSNRREIDKY